MHQEVELTTPRGAVSLRQYGPAGLDSVVLMVGGGGGGWDSPAKGLYERLATELPTRGVGAVRLKYRNPRSLHSCIQDVLAAMRDLERLGTQRIGLLGHSLGGAAVVNAALEMPEEAGAVVTLATQFSGLDDVGRLTCPILFVHGTDDEILPAACSVNAFRMAKDPRKLELMDGATHNLDECADQVYLLVREWVLEQLHEQHTGLSS